MTDFAELARVRNRHRGPSGAERFIEETRAWWPEWRRWAELTLFSIGHDTNCGEDVLQEFLLGLTIGVALDRLPKDAAPLAGYCHKIMRYRAIDHARGCRAEEHYGLVPPDHQGQYQCHPEEPTLEEICAPAELSKKQFRILRLWAEGLTSTEIAGQLNLTPAGVRARVARIIAKVRASLSVSLEVPTE